MADKDDKGKNETPEPPARTGRVELENRSDSIWLFEHPTLGDVVLGADEDRNVKERDPRFQPHPILTLDCADYAALRECDLKTIDFLVKKGDVQRRELAA